MPPSLSSRVPTRPRLWALLVLAAGLLVASALALWQKVSNEQDFAEATELIARREADLVVRRLALVESGLRSARGFLGAVGLDGLNREAFERYLRARDLGQEFPGALGFGVVRRVAAGHESAFLSALGASLPPGTALRQLSPFAGEHAVIQLIEPAARNRPVLGLDLASDAQRRAALQRALRSGEPTLSAPLRLVQTQPDAPRGLLMFLPVPLNGLPAAPRDFGVSGAPALVYAPLLVEELVRPRGGEARQVALRIVDLPDDAPPQLAYASEAADSAAGVAVTPGRRSAPALPASAARSATTGASRSLPVADFIGAAVDALDAGPTVAAGPDTVTLEREVYGRRWRIEVTPLPALRAGLRLPDPLAVFALGATFSLLLALIAQGLQAGRERDHAGLAERTRLATMLDHTHDAAVALDLEGRVVFWNRAAVQLFGYRAEQALGRTMATLVHVPEHAHADHEVVGRALAGQSAASVETVHRRKDGSRVEVEIAAGPILDENDHIAGVGQIIRDVAERQAASRQLEAYSRRLAEQVEARTAELARTSRDMRTVLDALPSMIGSWDLQLRNRFANRAYAEWFRKDAEALRGQPLAQLIGPRLFERLRPQIEAVLQGRPQTFEREFPLPDGQGARHALTHYLPDVDPQGQVQGFYVLTHDISAVKQAQRALAGSESLLREVIADLPFGVVVYDAELRLVMRNDRFDQMLALPEAWRSRTDLTLPDVLQLAHGRGDFPGIGYAELVARRRAEIASRQPIVFERQQIDGRFQETRITPLSRGWTLITYADISDIKRSEQELALARDAAEAASRAQGEFLAAMGQELRAPLASIVGLGQALAEQRAHDAATGSGSPAARGRDGGEAGTGRATRELVEGVEQACRDLMAVLGDVLDLSRIAAGQLRLEPASLALRPQLAALVEGLQARAAARDVELAVEVDEAVPAWVDLDGARFDQALGHLVEHALWRTPAGATVHLRADMADALGTRLRLQLVDGAPPIPAPLRSRLFDGVAPQALLSELVDRTDVADAAGHPPPGSGLSLVLVARLARLMGGDVRLDVEGACNRFVLELPLQAAPGA